MLTATKPETNGTEIVAKDFQPSSASRRIMSLAPPFFVASVLFLVLSVGGGLLMFGSTFAGNMVHDQLAAQKISFPVKGSAGLNPSEFPGLQRYAGQAVDNGPKAKAYANQFIAVHLNSVANGQTYSQVSAAAQANPSDTKLAAQVNTLFKGETLRGLLLYAWGWSVVAAIAGYAAWAAFAGALVVLVAMIYAELSARRTRVA